MQMSREPRKSCESDSKIDFDLEWGEAGRKRSSRQFLRFAGRECSGLFLRQASYRIATRNDDGVRVYVDGKLVIDDWKAEDSATQETFLELKSGSIHAFRVEYMQAYGRCHLQPSVGFLPIKTRTAFLIERFGFHLDMWQDLWTGQLVVGPKSISTAAALSQTPMWVPAGGIVLTGPELQYTGQKPMDPITADVYLAGRVINRRELDEGRWNIYRLSQR